MKKVKNWRTLSLFIWIVLTVITVLTMPDMNQLVRDKGQLTIPENAQSEVAQSMIKKMDENGDEAYQIIAVFNSGDDHELTKEQKKQIESVINQLKDKKEQLGIKDIVSHLDSKEVEKQLFSEDQTTILTQISVERATGTISEVTNRLYKGIEIKGVNTYLTGSEVVGEDFVQSSQEGIKTTEKIAVIFILAVLILIFRSPIVPVISLLTVGVSYIVSLGIIAHLVDQFNYPFSNFTQVFLVVILFGIGTDYNILLYTRFKEELSKQEDVLSAIKVTYKSAGKTVLYSGIAVFIGFMALILAEFKLYQASSPVAIGVAILLLVLITLNPFFMAVLGKRMFWPIKRFEGHADSRIWAFLASKSVLRPIISIIVVAILCTPFLLKYSSILSYNDLLEVDDVYASKQGIQIIDDHFPPGFSSPTTLVIQSDQKLDNQESLQILDGLSNKLLKIDGVSNVYTPTRPAGEKIEDLYIDNQTNTLYKGIGDANEGIGKISEGFSSTGNQLASNTNGQDSVQQLIDGTSALQNGVSAMGEAMNQVTAGMNDGSKGAEQLATGLASLKETVGTLSNGTAELSKSYNQLQVGLGAVGDQFSSIEQAIIGAKAGYEQIETLMTSYIQSNPEAANDSNVQKTIGIAKSGKEQLGKLAEELSKVTPQYNAAMSSFKEANTALAQVNKGLSQMETGVGKLQSGAVSLQSGLRDGAAGSSQIANKTTDLQSGLQQINAGQKQLQTGLNDLEKKMKKLQSGLSKSSEGLDEVSNGLADARGYLSGLSESEASDQLYIPKEVMKSEDFQKALDMYMSSDRQTVRMNIILDVNPYSAEAMLVVRNIETQVEASLKGSELSKAQVAIGGKTSQNADLQDIASGDFSRTATIMLIGIGLVLIIITRSFWQPIFIIGSLILAYSTSIGIAEMICTKILDVDYLSWNVPFFSFIMVIALGVDYSIFLMMRYREIEEGVFQVTAIIEAARHIGGVVISAAIILGGTFAALYPSGVVTLIEIATAVIIALILLSFVMLPIFIPALMALMAKLNSFSRGTKEI
ncbi:MMPL family transporter [Peribacillus asahii]|uniref:MMPL family transporter n=1 Tax=Peribacillus asahii TaxID=228899 RepID=UPI002079D043|nr:MMPL family transporter [Peribacillus asahii]USK71977.1 MMPL family transporter [Peribacillus asahii]